MDYYPFGLTFNSYQRTNSADQRYLNQGKEFQNDLVLDTYDFHARMYDPAIGRTFQLDPHAENYFNLSPFSWTANNPIIYIDPDGKDIYLGNLYEKDKDKKYKYETAIRAFEAFAATNIGREWIAARAQKGFKLDFAFEKGGIKVESAGELSSIVDYNFKVGNAKTGIALAESDTEKGKLNIDITLDETSSERSPTDAYTFMQLSDAVFHETNFHGFHAEERFMMGKSDLNTGDHKFSDLENSPFGKNGFNFYLYLVNKPSTKKMQGYEEFEKYNKNNSETSLYYRRKFIRMFK